MEIYKGYYYFRKHNGYIKKGDLNKQRTGSLIRCVCKGHISWDIIVNKKDSLKEQIKTVLHEFYHLGTEYEIFINAHNLGSMNAISPLNPVELENKIEKHIKKFYSRNPPIIDWIKEKLIEKNKTKH